MKWNQVVVNESVELNSIFVLPELLLKSLPRNIQPEFCCKLALRYNSWIPSDAVLYLQDKTASIQNYNGWHYQGAFVTLNRLDSNATQVQISHFISIQLYDELLKN